MHRVNNYGEIQSVDELILICSPDFLDLSADKISLNRISVMSGRYDYDSAVCKIIACHKQLKAGKRVPFSCFEDIVNICFKSDYSVLSKASSHQRL